MTRSAFGTKTRLILHELRRHAPFTALGAVLGVGFMLIFKNISHTSSHTLFAVFHPSHVLLSALVTASLFELHKRSAPFLTVLVVGYVGSVGIATLSDSVIPYFGERVLGLDIPTHHDLHQPNHPGAHETHAPPLDHPSRFGLHLGFIEEWYIVNPAALAGIILAYFLPRTKFPHAGHVLISTWASSAHVLMNAGGEITMGLAAGLFAVLFLAVWVPCCISDIVFPMLFVPADHHPALH